MNTCEEASPLSVHAYIPCGKLATSVVYHDRDERSYHMCTPCADHNCRNQGGELVSSSEKWLVERYGLTSMKGKE